MAKSGKIGKAKTKNETTRPFRPRKYEMFVLIVCEDKKTEPFYFKQFKEMFPENTVFIREIGTGKKPKGIVEQAIEERLKLSQEARKDIDEVWVVFDKDDEGNNETTLKSFNTAWELAENEQIRIAFSNEVFELWLLLHFCDVSSNVPIARADVYSMLGQEISSFESNKSFIYDHKKADPEKVIGAVFEYGNESNASERAKKLISEHRNKKPIEMNPSTTVHLLVKRLRDLIEWYSFTPN
jgi:hypothetical protein